MKEAHAFLFVEAVRLKAQQTVEEVKGLEHQLHGLEMRIARTKIYCKKLNDFLELHGGEPVALSTEEEIE